MKFFRYLIPIIVISQIIEADTMELITKNIKSVCDSPDQKNKYWEVKAEGKNNIDIKLLGMDDALKGTISTREWEGIQTVLKKQQAKENQNYQECVKELIPIFMNNFFKEETEKEKSPLLIKKDNFSIDLSVYEEGDLADELGKELLIKKIDKQNVISGLQSKPIGYVEIKGLTLSKKFMLTIINDINSKNIEFILRTRDDDIDNDIKISLVNWYLIFGNTKKSLNMRENNYKNGFKTNEFKLYMKKNVVKFYINDTYFGSIKANNKVVYDKFIIKSLNPKDYIYDISGYNIKN